MANSPTMPLGDRCHELKGPFRGIWQFKVTMGHNYRVWYKPDVEASAVLVVKVALTHPRETSE
ncbi:MAG: type II toxin-antitoxin system RelE family toxin [Candidatus Limnocylindrales bacterium]|jgi:hypothetical protein